MTRTLSIIPVVLMLAASAFAQDAITPRFFIEKIEVREASRVGIGVIIAESRLREGQEYSEAELSDAAARLSRLPFLLSAEFSLERGSERGRHVLVITVTETKPFFYLLDFVPVISTDPGRDSQNVDIVGNDRGGIGQNEGVIGARWFVGRRGAFHSGLFSREDQHEFTRDYGAAVIGYTQYDIFGTRAFATLNLKHPILNAGDPTFSPQLVVGIPLSPNQTLTLSYDETRFGTEEVTFFDGTPVERQDGDRIVSARVTYNTTNHPFLPTHGTLLSVTPLVAWRDGSSYRLSGFPGPAVNVTPVAFHERSVGIALDAARYFELSEQNSTWLRAEGGWGRVHERDSIDRDLHRDDRYGILQAGFSHSLWSREQQKRGDSRFEWSARFSTRTTGLGPAFVNEEDRFQLAFAWVRRSSFGTVRLGAGYAW